ncbi:RluA family pseudouridine synthase [Paenibacillus lupini]|uniref:RluA family pseudouridine synthase n=1 Tax=Paenibacillus lupini TaxID=1450204 RepID=UPI001421A3AD|nr:RluA family pseudouridine synthase [Paenibacillus lupini]NIK26459.1 23S rRNA pseudouridine1911/1915/1917 synthase [Paenibacillus lupini]
MMIEDIAGYYKPLVVEVGEAMAGKDVRTVLERKLGVSRTLLSKLKLTEFGITINGVRAYTTAKVAARDLVAIRMEEETSDDIMPQEMPLRIVFEDEYLLIVNKPAGIVVHPTHGHYTGTLANGIVQHWQARGEKVRFRPVHRLDEDTSGLVAIAKNPYIHQQLSEQLQAGTIMKLYCAYVYGSPDPADGTVDAPIDRDPDEPHVRIVTPEGYPSVTHYKTALVFGEDAAAKVRLKLETGRTHQIRVHMKHIGCPLIGDQMYGPKTSGNQLWENTAGRQALHAETLGLTHPMTKQWMEWTADLPPEFVALEQVLNEA